MKISWNTCGLQSYAESTSVPQDVGRSKHHFGCHSTLELVFSDGLVWQTHKYPVGSIVRLDFMRGIAAGELFKGPVQGDCINAGITGHEIRNFVMDSQHWNRYDTRDFNCHHYAQDVWNFCVTFRKQVWWRPDLIKATMFGDSSLVRRRIGYPPDPLPKYPPDPLPKRIWRPGELSDLAELRQVEPLDGERHNLLVCCIPGMLRGW